MIIMMIVIETPFLDKKIKFQSRRVKNLVWYSHKNDIIIILNLVIVYPTMLIMFAVLEINLSRKLWNKV